MSCPYRTRRRMATAVATACAGLALASAAGAVDLRDWGRKYSADQRFVVLAQFNNAAVLDKETQLLWERSPDPTPRSWYAADNTRCGQTAIGGRYGWRIPSRAEFMTLLDPNAMAPVKLPAGHPFVGIVPNGDYWTNDRASDPNPDLDQHKVKVSVATGVQFTAFLPGGFVGYTWCVRGMEAT